MTSASPNFDLVVDGETGIHVPPGDVPALRAAIERLLTDPELRAKDQDRDGVEAEVIYGIIGISRGLFTHAGITDHETLAAVYRAYNDYIADFNRTAPSRFFGLGCLPNHDARAAADEVRHCAELGLRGGVAAFTPDGVQFADGSEQAFELVILATGYRAAVRPLGDLIRLDPCGFAARRQRVVSADQPDLYFVGHNYDTRGGLRNIASDARLAARLIAGAHAGRGGSPGSNKS